jgi:dihydroflavonol-4-reductase
MSRVFVTGATGFLGKHLVAGLLARGHEVVALVRGEDPELLAGVVARRGDVTDAASVRDAAAGCTEAYHCAGLVSRDAADAEAMYRVHVDGTKTTLGALKEVGVKRVVVASTSGTIAVSRDPDEVRDEIAPAPMEQIARWPYYRSKLFGERAALALAGDGFEVIVVNPSLLLGPGDDRESSTEDVRKFLERKIPFSPGGGIAFVDARDAAEALILAMEKGTSGERYLVNAANMTVGAFFGRLERLSGVKAPSLKLPRAPVALAGVGADLLGRVASRLNLPAPVDKISAEMAQVFWYCDASRARTELGWTPREVGDTLADTIADLRDRGVVWPR